MSELEDEGKDESTDEKQFPNPEELSEKYPNNSLSRVDKRPAKRIKAKMRKLTPKREQNSFFVFLYREGKEIASWIFQEVLMPGFKNLLQNGIEDAIDMAFQGPERDDSYRRRHGRSGPRVISYGTVDYSSRYGIQRNSRPRRSSTGGRRTDRLDAITFEFRREANQVLQRLMDIQEQYGTVSVSDFLEEAGLPEAILPTDSIIGWDENINGATVRSARNGEFMIAFPPVSSIN